MLSVCLHFWSLSSYSFCLAMEQILSWSDGMLVTIVLLGFAYMTLHFLIFCFSLCMEKTRIYPTWQLQVYEKVGFSLDSFVWIISFPWCVCLNISADVHKQGAEVVRMYKTLLGSSGFRKVWPFRFRSHLTLLRFIFIRKLWSSNSWMVHLLLIQRNMLDINDSLYGLWF